MTDVSEQSVADVLNLAADLIEPEGAWTQGAWENINGCRCAEGAIFAAAKQLGVRSRDAHQFFERQVPRPSDPEKTAIPFWNDADERTQAEVVAALRSAAILAAPRAGEGE